MEKRLSYIVVGLFVIVLTLSLFVFMFWLTRYGEERVEHDYYYTYFTESVSGLSVESPVKYRGVEVGRVKDISINKKNSEEVQILLEIKKGTPIKRDTYAVLDTQGITGLKYIELKGGSNDSPLIVSRDGKIGVIDSKKSVLTMLFDNGEGITKKVNAILNKVQTVFSEKNMKKIDSIITNLSSTTTYIDSNKQKVADMFEQITELKQNIEKNLDAATKSFMTLSKDSSRFLEHTKILEDRLMPSFDKLGYMSDRVSAASDSTKVFFDNIDMELKRGEFSFADIVERNMEILNQTALALRDLSLKLDETVGELKNSPSDLLYKSVKKIPGPGEEDE